MARNAVPVLGREVAIRAMPSIFDLVGKPPKARMPSGKRREALVAAAHDRAATGKWDGAKGGELVGLYCALHRIVYGVAPSELDNGKEWRSATTRADGFLKEEFGGDARACADFIAWVWRREEGRDKYRQQNDKERTRLPWRWQFCQAIVTDYRVALAKGNK
jgi:hypothetical protein